MERPVVEVGPEAQSVEPADPLARARLPEEFKSEQERLLALARDAAETSPEDAMAQIWVGRRLGYLGRYTEAIEWYSQVIERFPEDARLFRHRGHRYITTRRLDAAIADLVRAAELAEGTLDRVEPDGLPNAQGIPTSTTQTNIWYHLGLAYYLQERYEEADTAYRECLRLSMNPDMVAATAYWLYLTQTRLGLVEGAETVLASIPADMELIENLDYHRLLMVYKGNEGPGDLLDRARQEGGVMHATLGYGIGVWFLHNGDQAAAAVIFREVVQGDRPASFGFIAAEAELARGSTVNAG